MGSCDTCTCLKMILRCQMVSGWMENGNHCQYVELRRGPKLIQTALIKQMKPDSIYKISIAKIYKDDNGNIISSSNPVEKQIKTLTKNEEKCWDENSVSIPPPYFRSDFRS